MMTFSSPSPLDGQPAGAASARALRLMALDAQAALLPYALAFFAVGLMLFAWTSSFAANAPLMIVSLAIFAINWGVFYALATTVRRRPELMSNAVARTRIHVLGGLLWAVAIAQISAFALGAGPARESILILACAGAMATFFFLSPVLISLLIVAPLACAGPLICLYLLPETQPTATFTTGVMGALALGMTLALVVNRILERQFALTVERDRLTSAYEEAARSAGRLAKSKSALIATLSHEIRNGLAGVTYVLAAAAGVSARSTPSREQLRAALEASRDLAGVLDATLDTETAEAGQLSVAVEPFDPARLVRDLGYLAQPLAAAKGLELTVFVDPGLAGGAVMADPARTRQVVSNMIGNALKYTARGRVELRVRREGETRARFEIADTGPGLTPEEIQLAFEPFARIDRTSAGSAGAGLGLSLARSLAGLMGGEVGVVSAAGAGSCFWLDLTYDPAAEVSHDPADDDQPSAALFVLSVVENRLAAANLRATLEDLGHQVIQAQNAERASELLKIGRIDVIVASSPEIIAAMRSVGAGEPILALTDGDPEAAAACLAAGCAGVLRPPLSATAMARALATLDFRKPKAANAA